MSPLSLTRGGEGGTLWSGGGRDALFKIALGRDCRQGDGGKRLENLKIVQGIIPLFGCPGLGCQRPKLTTQAVGELYRRCGVWRERHDLPVSIERVITLGLIKPTLRELAIDLLPQCRQFSAVGFPFCLVLPVGIARQPVDG